MNDFLTPLATLSRPFQSDKLLIYQVASKIDATILALTAFKSDPGIHMSTFVKILKGKASGALHWLMRECHFLPVQTTKHWSQS